MNNIENERMARIETHIEHILEELKVNREQYDRLEIYIKEKLDEKYASKRTEAIVYSFIAFFTSTLTWLVIQFLGMK